MRLRKLVFAACLGSLAAHAGEIIIVQPAGKQSRVEREPGNSADKARQYQSRQGPSPLLIEDGSTVGGADNAERSAGDARYYQRSSPDGAVDEGTTIILRAAPPTDTDRLRQRARSMVAPAAPLRRDRNCGEAKTSVGMIGEGAGAQHSGNVVESGNSAVNVNCK